MRIVASIQSKRGSSRGLVHYVAHSKIDLEKEPAKSRELFNGFGDSLDVKSANNHLKVDISRRRPSNDELHHLVLSFRADDYAKFGRTEMERRRAAKQITRAALARLENSLNADKLAWAAAVHLNTVNPHVHIAIQKQYFTKELERKTLTKIPREAIPHYEKSQDGTKQLSPGFLIDAASEKMEEIIHQNESRKKRRTGKSNRTERRASSTEEHILAQGLLRKFELKSCTEKLEAITRQGNKLRFRVYDAVTGTNRRMSIEAIEHRAGTRSQAEIRRNHIVDPVAAEGLKKRYLNSALELNAAPVRRIRTILFKLTAKEETKRQEFERKFKSIDPKVKAIQAACRRESRKLPTPALTKKELDHLQGQCLAVDDIRTFSYLERVRSELSASGKIEPRDDYDTQRLSALKVIHSLRLELHKKQTTESIEHRYVRFVDLDGTRWSLSELDKRRDQPTFGYTLLEKLGFRTKHRQGESGERPREVLRTQILEKLELEDRQAVARQHREEKKVIILDAVLKVGRGTRPFDPDNAVFDSHQLAEIESLSFRLKNPTHYEQSWEMQKLLIEQAGPASHLGRKILKASPDTKTEKVFAERKNIVIAGRALAREIVARTQLDEAKSNLKRFSRAKQFHKFEVVNEKSGTREFVSLKDVEVVRSGSLLNQAVDYLSESRERRQMRAAVRKEIKQREKNLKAELIAAKGIFAGASRVAAEHKTASLFGINAVLVQEPIFTSFELALIERHVAGTIDRGEFRQFNKILVGARENAVDSLGKLLAGFETSRGHEGEARELKPETALARDRKSEHLYLSESGGPRSTAQKAHLPEPGFNRSKQHDPKAVSR